MLSAESAVVVEYADCISSKGYDPSKECPELHRMVRIQLWSLGNVEYPFANITPWFTLTLSGSTCWSPIYESNMFNLFL